MNCFAVTAHKIDSLSTALLHELQTETTKKISEEFLKYCLTPKGLDGNNFSTIYVSSINNDYFMFSLLSSTKNTADKDLYIVYEYFCVLTFA